MEPYKEVSVNSGEDITLTCDVEGTPAPRVIWQIGTRIVANFPRKLVNYIYSTVPSSALCVFLFFSSL